MDATDMTGTLHPTPTPSGDAIRQIVQVFEDGCRAAAALRRTADDLSSSELETELNSIELRMVHQISSICERFARSAPRGAGAAGDRTISVSDFDFLAELPTRPAN